MKANILKSVLLAMTLVLAGCGGTGDSLENLSPDLWEEWDPAGE